MPPSEGSAGGGSRSATDPTPPLQVALIGCGQICQSSHWPGIRDFASGLLSVTAVVDMVPAMADKMAALVADSGAPAPAKFTSVEAALQAVGTNGDRLFNAVDIMLPHHLHRPVATQCLAAGVHVCLEKPMAHTLADAEAILRAAAAAEAEHGSVFFMAEQSQFWPEIVLAKQLIEGGAIGELWSARCILNNAPRGPTEARAEPLKPHEVWRASFATAGGGVIMDGGAHWIRPLRTIMVSTKRFENPRRLRRSGRLDLTITSAVAGRNRGCDRSDPGNARRRGGVIWACAVPA